MTVFCRSSPHPGTTENVAWWDEPDWVLVLLVPRGFVMGQGGAVRLPSRT